MERDGYANHHYRWLLCCRYQNPFGDGQGDPFGDDGIEQLTEIVPSVGDIIAGAVLMDGGWKNVSMKVVEREFCIGSDFFKHHNERNPSEDLGELITVYVEVIEAIEIE